MGIPATRVIHESMKAAPPRSIVQYLFVIKLVAFTSIATSPFWLTALFFSDPQDYSYTSSLICVPLLAIVCAVAIAHFTQSDPYLRRLSMASLVAHMVASSVFLWVGIVVYGGIADTFHYWTVGMGIASQFQIVGWSVFQPPYWSTNLIFNLCGFAALLIGDAMPTLFIASAFLSLAGGYLFYRAFVSAFPDGDRWLFGLLVLLLPSILFWSSFIGKDAPIQFFIALTCFGFARLMQRPGPRSVLLCVAGLAGALLIRAHVAAMLALAMTSSYVVGRPRAGGANPAARILLIPILLAGSYFLVNQAKHLIDSQGDNASSVVEQANTLTKFSQIGGSSFNEGVSLPVRIAESPFLIFRPFPWEIHSSMAFVSALESAGLLFLCWRRRREIWSTLRQWRNPYVSFLVMYSLIFLITFGGAISNLGTLLRQRIMMMPVVLMILCAKQVPLVQVPLRRSARSARQMSPAGDRIPVGD